MNTATISTAILFTALSLAAPPDPSGVRAPIQPAAERKPAPELRLKNASGQTVRIADLRGKVTLLNFWATACGGCVKEIPSFIDLQGAYKAQGLAAVGVSLDISYEGLKNAMEAWSRVNPFVRDHHLNYSILMDDGTSEKIYKLESLPATYLIDKHGRIAATYVGVVDKGDVEANIKALLSE